jgi:hypothetical protein
MKLAEKITLKSPFNIDEINGIKFKDIKHIIKSKEDFENMLFSTKILFESKEELLEFFEMLLKYGYKESALNYLEELILNNDYDIIEGFNSLLR